MALAAGRCRLFHLRGPRDNVLVVAWVIHAQTRSVMVARGRVRNGVVVLEDRVRLPEGQEVTGLVPGTIATDGARRHSIVDIPPVSVGAVLRPLTSDDDLLGEMLEGRP